MRNVDLSRSGGRWKGTVTTNRPWELDLNTVPDRPVNRSGLLLRAAGGGIYGKVVVLDPTTAGARLCRISHPRGPSPARAICRRHARAVLVWSLEDNGRTMCFWCCTRWRPGNANVSVTLLVNRRAR
jgi:hypothetical protein